MPLTHFDVATRGQHGQDNLIVIRPHPEFHLMPGEMSYRRILHWLHRFLAHPNYYRQMAIWLAWENAYNERFIPFAWDLWEFDDLYTEVQDYFDFADPFGNHDIRGKSPFSEPFVNMALFSDTSDLAVSRANPAPSFIEKTPSVLILACWHVLVVSVWKLFLTHQWVKLSRLGLSGGEGHWHAILDNPHSPHGGGRRKGQ